MQKRILWCSDSSDIPTGYTDQTIWILRALAARYQTFLLGHQYGGAEKQATTPMGLEPWTQLPGNYEGGTISYYVNRVRPQIVAWLCDAFMVPWIKDKRKEWARLGNPKTLFYFPMDSDDVYDGMEQTLASVDYRVAMSQFAHKKLKKETGLDSYVIPHCTDVNMFYPLTTEQKEQLKAQNGLAGKFVIGMVGRNQSRKNPQRLMYILKDFCDQHEDVYGFFHCDPYDPMSTTGRYDLHNHAKLIGLNDHAPSKPDCPKCRLKFTGVPFFSGLPKPQLNTIFNMFDINTMSTTGEGFGITTIEAMACGVPSVITDYTTTQELLVDGGRCGEPVKWNTFINGGYGTKRVLPDEQDFLNKLEKLYQNEQLRKQYGEQGRWKVMQKYSLQAVMPMWQNLFSQILEEDRIVCQV